MDKVGLLVAEQVDEHLVLHLRERDPDGGPAQIVVRFLDLEDKKGLQGLERFDINTFLLDYKIMLKAY